MSHTTSAGSVSDPPPADDFEAFYRTVFPQLAGYCRTLVGETERGRDIAQEALVRTFSRWVGVRHPKAYVYLVATNLARDFLRRNAREQGSPRADEPLVGDTSAAFVVRDVVAQLPDTLREVVVLHYFADLPIHEIARVTRRPEGTVKRRLHEARERLALLLR